MDVDVHDPPEDDGTQEVESLVEEAIKDRSRNENTEATNTINEQRQSEIQTAENTISSTDGSRSQPYSVDGAEEGAKQLLSSPSIRTPRVGRTDWNSVTDNVTSDEPLALESRPSQDGSGVTSPWPTAVPSSNDSNSLPTSSWWPTKLLADADTTQPPPVQSDALRLIEPSIEQGGMSRRSSNAMIEAIKTIARVEDPEDDPGFIERNPTWEDSLDPTSIVVDKKMETETEQNKLQSAFNAIANAESGGVIINKHDSIATKRWKNAYTSLKHLLALRKLEQTSRVGTGAEMDGYSLGLFSPKNPMRKAECLLRIFALGFIKGPHSYLKNNYNKLDFIIIIDSWVHIYEFIIGNDGFFRFAALRTFRALLTLRHFSFFANVIAIMDACQASLIPLGNVLLLIVIIFSFYALIGMQYFGGALDARCVRASDNSVPYIQEFCGARGKSCDDNTTIATYLYTFCVKGLVCTSNATTPNASPGLQTCNKTYGNPNWGASDYDGFGQAILILFQLVSFEGWALQMYSMSDAVGTNSEAYYILMMIIGSYFAVNVCIAAISGVFIRVRHEHQVLLKKHKREQQFTFHNAIKLANVLKDVIKKDDAKLTWLEYFQRKTGTYKRSVSHYVRQRTKKFKSMSMKGPSFLKRQMSRGMSFGSQDSDDDDDDDNDNDDESGSFHRSRSSNKKISRSLSRSVSRNAKSFGKSASIRTRHTIRKLNHILVTLVKSRFFRYYELLMISLNFIILCCISTSMSSSLSSNIYALQIFFLSAFTIEIVLRALAHGWRRWKKDVMNYLDIIVVIVSFWGITSATWPNLSAIRLLRWFHDPKEKKFGKSEETPSPLRLCLKSMDVLGGLAFFFCVLIVVFSIISMELYSGQFQQFPEGNPRENHDTFPMAVLTWFGISTGESWINQLWNAMRPGVEYSWISPYLFCFFFIIETYVVINLIIAVILENTELTDNQKKSIQRREYLKFLRTQHSRAKSLRTGDWLVDAVEGTQANIHQIYRNISFMAPVSKKVKRVNIPNESTGEASNSNALEASQQSGNQSGRSSLSRRPRSSAVLHAILAKDKDSGDYPESSPLPPYAKRRESSCYDMATGCKKGRASLDPNLLAHSGNTITNEMRFREHALRRRSNSVMETSQVNPFGTGLYRRRPSKAAAQILVGAGFSNRTTHQDFPEEKTALQSAMLALTSDLNMPQSAQQYPVQSNNEQIQGPPTSTLSTVEEGSKVNVDLDNKVGKGPTKPKVDLYHSLSVKDPKKRPSFVLDEFEGVSQQYRDTPWYFTDKSLFIFESTGPTRRFLIFVVENIWYKRFIMCCCIIAVFIVTQLNPAGFINNGGVDKMDRFLLFTWTLDVTIKSIAYGVIFAPEAYLGDPFNIIDVCNMFFQWIGFNPPSEAYSRIVHIMNTIRGTRFIPRIHGLRILVSTILHTIPAVASMFGFIICIYFIFATIGVQMFHGRFASCTDSNVPSRAECVGTFVNPVGLMSHRVWMNPDKLHFDNFGSAMLSLFVCSTTDNWIDYFLHTSMDIPNTLYDSPIQNNKPANSLFFIIFIVIENWLVIRLLIGVFIDQFGIISGSKLLTERQKLWRDMNRIVQSLAPRRLPKIPRKSIRRKCYKFTHSSVFDWMMVCVLFANYCVLASHRLDNYANYTFSHVEIGFVIFYWIEAIIKFMGNELSDWIQDWWNLAELVLVIASSACLMPTIGTLNSEWGRVLQLLRLFRVIRFLPNLRDLVHTVLVSLPSLVYVIELLGIWLLEFAMIFYQSFPYINSGNCINQNVRFDRFTPSFVFAFQATTLDNWSCVMLELMNAPPYCIASTGYHDSSCGVPTSALVYFIMIVYIMTHIITNLFIAQIIDTISFGLLNEDAMLTPPHLTSFQNLWAQEKFDPMCTGYIGLHNLREFVYKLGTPLGRRHNAPAKWYRYVQYEVYYFHVFNKGIPFRNLLETLVLYKIGSQGLILALRIEREKKLREIFRYGAAIRIQSEIRRYLVHKGFKVSRPRDILLVKEVVVDWDDLNLTKFERKNKKIKARLKVLLITGY